MEPGAVLAPPARARVLAWSSVLVVVVATLFASVHPWYDTTNDGSMYIATARALVAGEGYSYLGMPFLIRPPGFSCLLAPLLAWRGTDFFAFNLMVSLFGALGVLLFHFLLRPRLGLVLAVLVPLIVWFNPGYQELCNQVMSDVPGWTALVGCLLLAARSRGSRASVRALGLGAAIGLASYLRSGDLLLMPALVCAWLASEVFGKDRLGWRVRARDCAALVLGTVLVLAPWSLRNRAVAPPPPADQTLLYSYSTGMWHTDMGDPRSPRLPLRVVLARFPNQGAKILHTLGTRMRGGEAGTGALVVALGLLLALLVAAVRRRAPEELFTLGTLVVVAFYFGYASRLMLPVFALAVAAAIELVRDGATRLAGRRVGSALAALTCLAWIALDWRPRANWAEVEQVHRAYARTARQVEERLPDGARLGAYIGWHHSVFLERPVYSFSHALERGGEPAAAEAIIDKYDLDTVLLTPVGLPQPAGMAERGFAAYIARRYKTPDLGLVRVR